MITSIAGITCGHRAPFDPHARIGHFHLNMRLYMIENREPIMTASHH